MIPATGYFSFPIATSSPTTALRNSAARDPITMKSPSSVKSSIDPETHSADFNLAASVLIPKQVITGCSGLDTIPNKAGSARSTMVSPSSLSTTSTGTLLKKRSETFFSNTIISLSELRMRSNIWIAPWRIVTTHNIVATPKAIPVAPIVVRTRCRRRLVLIRRSKLILYRSWTFPALHPARM